MIALDRYLVWICLALLLVCCILFFRWSRKRKELGGARQFIKDALEAALFQKSTFDIRLVEGSGKSGVTATLEALSRDGLRLLANCFVEDAWNKKPVEVFFRVSQPEGPIFYVFNSRIDKLAPGAAASSINLAMPAHLRIEKKRHFVRVSPRAEDVFMIAVWPAAPGKRLPRSSADMGQPATRWKSGQAEETVQLENISGGGVALRFMSGENGLPFPAGKGKQLICLIAYRPAKDAEKPVVFWCSAEIMNTRQAGCAVALGLEFTNWAVQEHGHTEIHWTHSSPWQGAKPILAWVSQIDQAPAS